MTPAQVAKIMALVDEYLYAPLKQKRAAIEAALRDAPQAEGWVMVPIEPTPEMLACILEPIKWAGGKAAYCAMLAARPSAPTAVEPDERAEFEAWWVSKPHRLKYSSDHPVYLSATEAWQARASKGTPL